MAFNHQEYNAAYLENIRAGNEALNDAAENYGVKIEPAAVQPGEKYWRVIGVHHLEPLENLSNHHAYLEALDEQGNRVRNPTAWIGWTWENRQPNEPANPAPIDKPDNEPGCNIAIGKNQIISVWIGGRSPTAADKSDKVTGIRTTHPDEPLSDGSLHNTWGHHSFYAVFQETTQSAAARPSESVIFGRLTGGAGQTVRLLRQNATVTEVAIGAGETFRFEGLPAGIYTVTVAEAAVRRTGLQLDGKNSLEVNLAMPAPQTGAIQGVVANGLGYTIILGKGSAVIDRQTLPPDGSFRFDNLPAGVYDLAVWDTPAKAADIEVDGKQTRTVSLDIAATQPAPGQAKAIDHYVLFGPPQSRGRRVNLFVAMNYLLHFSLSSGFSVETAQQASRVTIIGEGISAAKLEAIRQSGAKVEQLTGDSYEIENILRQRIAAGRAFGN